VILRALTILGLALCSSRLTPGRRHREPARQSSNHRSLRRRNRAARIAAAANSDPGSHPRPDLSRALQLSARAARASDVSSGAPRGHLVPALAISEEFTDNFFLNNANKQSEFITGFTPSITLLANRLGSSWLPGFSNTSELYAEGEHRERCLRRQNLIAGMYYQPTPQLTFTVADTFLREQSRTPPPEVLPSGAGLDE